MYRALIFLSLLGISLHVYAEEGFLNHLSKTTRLLSENELDKFKTTTDLKAPKPNLVPGYLLKNLLPQDTTGPNYVCPDDVPKKADDKNVRYEVIVVGRSGIDSYSAEELPEDLSKGLNLQHLTDLYGPTKIGREDEGQSLVGPGVYRDPKDPTRPIVGTPPITGEFQLPNIGRQSLEGLTMHPPRDLGSIIIDGKGTQNPVPEPTTPVVSEPKTEEPKAPIRPDFQTNLNAEEVAKQAQDAYMFMREATPYYYPKGDYTNKFIPKFDINSTIGKQLVVEGIVQAAAAHTDLSENELAEKVGGILNEIYKTEEERFEALRTLSYRLNGRNYNMPRNPGRNTPDNNPEERELPKGDLTLNQLLKAASEYDNFAGGVCNDNAEAVAIVASKMFPDKTILTVNSGSHFAAMIADGKSTRVIDGSLMHKMSNDLYLQPNSGVPNLHISKVGKDGKLREIAIADTQIGQFSEAVFDTGKTLLMTSNYASTIVSHFNNYKKAKDGSIDKTSLSVGMAGLNRGSMVMVVAKYENTSDRASSYIGAGFGALKLVDRDALPRYQVQVRTGAKANLFHFIHEKAEVRIETGFQGEAMFALDNDLTNLTTSLDFGWAVEWVNRAVMNYGRNDRKGVQVSVNAEVRSGIAPENWGDATGTMSTLNAENVLKTLGSLRFYVNQVNGNVTVGKEIGDAVYAQGTVAYQGSNIGQSISAMTGLTIKAPANAQIMVFVGYTNSKIPGYQTNHSLLVGPHGGTAGAGVQLKRGPAVKGQVRGIGTDRVSGDVIFEVPIDSAK